ncbi:hypothetical protein KKC1_34940, partial [Calderihabitans maritimus]
MGDYYLPAGNT